MNCTHSLPSELCAVCQSKRKAAQNPPEHVDDGLNLITSVAPAEDGDGWTCKVFQIGGRLIDSFTIKGASVNYHKAVGFAEWMVECIHENDSWHDWRESQRLQPAVQ